MKCLEDASGAAAAAGRRRDPVSAGAAAPGRAGDECRPGQIWRTPTSLAELAQLMARSRGETFRLVHGNTSFGVYKDEFPATKLFIDIRLIPELHAPGAVSEHALVVGAGTSYGDLIDLLADADADGADQHAGGAGLHGTAHGRPDRPQRRVAGRQHDARAETYRGGHRRAVPVGLVYRPGGGRRQDYLSRARTRQLSANYGDGRRTGGGGAAEPQRWPTAS